MLNKSKPLCLIFSFKQIYLGLRYSINDFDSGGAKKPFIMQNKAAIAYDIGAHLGLDSAYYLQMGYKVVAVEANPVLCSYLRHKFCFEIQEKKFILIEAAISHVSNDEVPFFLCEE